MRNLATLNYSPLGPLDSLVAKESEIVHAIQVNGLIEPISPIPASQVRCPMCGSDKGMILASPHAWSCLHNECLKRNAVKSPQLYDGRRLTMRQCLVPEELQSASIASLTPEQKPEELLEWAQKTQGILTLSGIPGIGKSYAAAAVINQYIKTQIDLCRFVSMIEWRAKWMFNNEEARINLQKYQQAKLLVLDDLGQSDFPDGMKDAVFYLINDRASRDVGTIITTNRNSIEMSAMLGTAFVSRLAKSTIIKIKGQDRRVKW